MSRLSTPQLWPAATQRSGLTLAALVLTALLCSSSASSARQRTNDELPERYRKYPLSEKSLSVGLPNAGWQLRARKLRASRELWIQDKSIPYSYGHPSLVWMLYRTAKQMARASKGSVLLVGDLSREFGGPLAGHKSHQSGRDADVGFFVTDTHGRPINSRRLVTFDAAGKARDGSDVRFDDYRNWLLVQTWLKEERAALEHVFVASHLRRRLLDFARARPAFVRYVEGASRFLRQPTHGLPHDDHFHVRIACPEYQQDLCSGHAARR